MDYARIPDRGQGLRLHLNENTGGCSPAVLAAVRSLSAEDMAFYPDYGPTVSACAAWLGVASSQVVLVNGLDEGIWAAAAALIRGSRNEAIVVEPAFDMYAASVRAIGGTVVAIESGPGFRFPLEAVLAAVGPATALVYLCSPNNPTGLAIEPAAIEAIGRALRPGSIVFLDEAYVDFARESFLPRLAASPNVVIGRTFAKAHGLAAIRAGCLVSTPETLALVASVIPPYSVNVCALAAMRAAVADLGYQRDYCAQVARSRELIYAACERLALPYWRSEANFVLVRVGAGAADLVEALARRGVFIRDRTTEPGCEGCVRITAGLVEHTRTCLEAMEEVLCAGA